MVCMVCMVRGCISFHFDNIPLKLSTHVYLMTLFHYMQSGTPAAGGQRGSGAAGARFPF